MKQLTAYLGLFIAAFFANNSVLSQDTIPPPPVRDSMIVEYYFCWAREWDDTIYYTQMIEVMQDTVSHKKFKIDNDFKQFMKQDLRLKNDYAPYVDGPFYDSASFNLYFDYWINYIVDTIPSKQVFFMPRNN